MSRTLPARRRGLTRAVAGATSALLLAAGITIAGTAPAMAAPACEPGSIAGATLDWGVKESFRNYVTSPVAHGTVTLTGDVSSSPSPYRWSDGDGSYDPAAHAGSVGFDAEVAFSGHDGQLALTLADPRIELTGSTSGTLYVDVSSKALGTGEVTNESDVAFAILSFTSSVSGSTLSLTGTSALTEDGAASFAGFYTAGTALDPITLTAPLASPCATTTSLTASPAGQADEGEPVILTASVAPAAAGEVVFRDGTAELGRVAVSSGSAHLTSDELAEGSHSLTAEFVPADTDYLGSTSSALSYLVVAPGAPAAPAIAVPGTPIANTGGTVAVTGSGFTPNVNVYVAVAAKSVQDKSDWTVKPAYFQGAARLKPASDGTFAVTLTSLSAVYDSNGTSVDCLAVECGVYAWTADHQPVPAQFVYAPVTFAPADTTPEPRKPVASIVGGSSSVSQGGTITFTGTGFVPGELVSAEVHSTPIPLGSKTADLTGSVTFTWTVPAGFEATGHTLVLTAPSGTAQIPFTVVAARPSGSEQPVCVARAISGATLDWGVKESFRNYITGGIANGSITTSGVTGGSVFGWSGGTGAYNTDASRGIVRLPGSVHFEGHDGVLKLTLSNVRVQLTSASAGMLYADVVSSDMSGAESTHSGVAFASLSFASSVSGGALAIDGASATLTSSGAAAFAGFYSAGTALDPVSLRAPLGDEVDCDSLTLADLAFTGRDDGDALGMAALLGVLCLLVGAGLLARRVRTRRMPAVAARAEGRA